MNAHRRSVIAVIGDGDAPVQTAAIARQVGRGIVGRGWRLVTGGLGGVMEAASRGAREAEAYREGDVLGVLPTGDAASANSFVDIAVPTNMGYARNTIIVTMADVVVAVGGGAGTLTEIAMAWQLGRPIVALCSGPDGEVAGWSHRLGGERIDGRPRAPIVAASSVNEALDAVALALSSSGRG